MWSSLALRQKYKKLTMKKPMENTEEFLNIIKEWQTLEKRTIESANELINRTGNNPLVRMTMEMIKHDSAKHKVMLHMVIDNLTKEAAHLNTDELASLSDLLHRHIEIEAKSIAVANDALQKCKLKIIRYILSALLNDEKNHHSQLHELNEELKRAAIFIT